MCQWKEQQGQILGNIVQIDVKLLRTAASNDLSRCSKSVQDVHGCTRIYLSIERSKIADQTRWRPSRRCSGCPLAARGALSRWWRAATTGASRASASGGSPFQCSTARTQVHGLIPRHRGTCRVIVPETSQRPQYMITSPAAESIAQLSGV